MDATARPRQNSSVSFGSSSSRHEYLERLVVPSAEELARIAQVQTHREAQVRRRSREIKRQELGLVTGRAERAVTAVAEEAASAGPAHRRNDSLLQRLGQSLGQSLTWTLGLGLGFDNLTRARAAIIIQRHYRGYKTRRELAGLSIDANTRWQHALRDLQYQQVTRPDEDEDEDEDEPLSPGSRISRRNSAQQYWKKATTVVLRAGLDQDVDSDSDSDSDSDTNSTTSSPAAKQARQEDRARRRRQSRTMPLAYFLEMVDPLHRYGANLRVYHEEWKRASTTQNFFHWLDHGDGRLLDMAACPRERLGREQVRYLSREERQYYLVKVDGDGRLCWAKNGARIDTTEQWRDSIHGIVPLDDPTPAFYVPPPIRTIRDEAARVKTGLDSDCASLSSMSSVAPASPAQPAQPVRRVHHLSATTVFDALLRKSVQKNTWIFVADTSFRLYVGVKNSGTFQHSSFLQGTRILAAGLLQIRDGRLVSLSPLSGHYRPPASNFRAFVDSLRETGVDMNHMTLSKSYGILVGFETYMKTRQRGRDLLRKMGRRPDGEEPEKNAHTTS